MKKMILILAVLAFCNVAADAQQHEKPAQKMEKKSKEMGEHDCYMMKDGKMYHVRGDKFELMKGDVVTKNGTRIMENGTCKMKDGREVQLKEGECCTRHGKIKHMEKEMMK